MAHVLIIDDEAALRELISEVLREAGHRTSEADSGIMGLVAIRREHPDLVVCDVQMPGLDGHGVLKAVRLDPELAGTPFLFLTGQGTPQDVRAGMSLGADDYLAKPVSPADLLAAVSTRLARHDSLRHQAEQRMEEMRRSVAVLLPHELRTPLTVVLGSARFLQEAGRELQPDVVESMAGMIVKAAQRLHHMVENYLLYTSLQLQKLSATEPSPRGDVANAEDVREAAQDAAASAERASDLRLDLQDGKLAVGPPYLRKIVGELLDNSFKFSSPGQPVLISLRIDAEAAVLEVVDAGRGMTRNQVRNSSAFVQFDRAIFEQQGSGLGLALVRGIVDGTGGRLEIDSESGNGTRVRAAWPVRPSTT